MTNLVTVRLSTNTFRAPVLAGAFFCTLAAGQTKIGCQVDNFTPSIVRLIQMSSPVKSRRIAERFRYGSYRLLNLRTNF